MSEKLPPLIEQEPRFESLDRLLYETAERSRQEGVPVGEDCRLQEEAYRTVYGLLTVEEDLRQCAKLEGTPEEDRGSREGELLEGLKTVLFHKNAGGSFLAVRAARFDDYTNRVDNVIVYRPTGLPICALDEVADTGRHLYEKQQRILDQNLTEGATLKYGISLSRKRIELGTVEHIPIFYLAVSRRFLLQALYNMEPTLDKQSWQEKFLFDYFLISIHTQIERLRSMEGRFRNQVMRARVRELEKILEQDFQVRERARSLKLEKLLEP